ncbi:RNA polymerase sigma factor [Polyangium sorediatum]|uniref:Sigma factor-like helix-turn-helix DNA-binding protein n=1 Tax=Polyangium sorediatum TaxID=889274 RepID=A0ABT6P470_9BACT|nr:sigma factor-like helix-turn-helix DNA-binding protein [Polyangium sorediatum]MDI1435388.1 sigma factor-like helix-turn-helix DNA-binding protein [Polyangium sorediatum]
MTTPEPAAPPLGSFASLYQAYAAQLPHWFRRLRVPAVSTADAEQEVWQAVTEAPESIPTSPTEARRALFDLAVRVAQNHRRREARNAARRSAVAVDDIESDRPNLEEQAAVALALIEALEELRDEATRRMVLANKVLGYTEPEIAARFGMPVNTVHSRIRRACVQLAKRLRANDAREERRGVLLLPGAIVFDPEIRAAMAAILSVDGRLPSFGGGGPGDPPPPPPPPPPPVPKAPGLASSPTTASNLAALVVLLLLGPACAAALVFLFLGPPERPALARGGLFVPTPRIDFGEPHESAHASATPPPTLPTSAPTSTPSTRAPRPETLSDEARRALRLDRPAFTHTRGE